MQVRVHAAARESCGVRALLHQAALVEDEHLVGVFDRRQPVRDDERRAIGHQVVQRVLDQPLGFGVERGGRLVEDQDRRVAQERACDGQALALAAGQQRAVFADCACPCPSGSRSTNSMRSRLAPPPQSARDRRRWP